MSTTRHIKGEGGRHTNQPKTPEQSYQSADLDENYTARLLGRRVAGGHCVDEIRAQSSLG
jgi:hypothetical protein